MTNTPNNIAEVEMTKLTDRLEVLLLLTSYTIDSYGEFVPVNWEKSPMPRQARQQIQSDLLALLPPRMLVNVKPPTDNTSVTVQNMVDRTNWENSIHNQAISDMEQAIKEYCEVADEQ